MSRPTFVRHESDGDGLWTSGEGRKSIGHAPSSAENHELQLALPTDRKFLFLCGLHRSGTTALYRCLAYHPLITGLQDTGVPRDEGQFLQTVYPPGSRFGGPGVFGFDPEARLTNTSELVSADNARRIFTEWAKYWDLSKPLLLEKSPTNIVRMPFLEALFPQSYFIVLTRHPVAVALATQRWSKTSLHSLLRHWVRCHEIAFEDAETLARCHVVKYEDLVREPEATLEALVGFLGIPHVRCVDMRIEDHNPGYFRKWQSLTSNRLTGPYARELIKRFEADVRRFGYSLTEIQGPQPITATIDEPPHRFFLGDIEARLADWTFRLGAWCRRQFYEAKWAMGAALGRKSHSRHLSDAARISGRGVEQDDPENSELKGQNE